MDFKFDQRQKYYFTYLLLISCTSWSALTVWNNDLDLGRNCPVNNEIILVKLNATAFTQMELFSDTYYSGQVIWAGAGSQMNAVHQFLEDNELAFPACPNLGDVTLGGVLAIGEN